MTVSLAAVERLAADYTAAWNTGRAEAVASFFAETGGIVINRGPLWQGRAGVAAMAAGFYADVRLCCTNRLRAGVPLSPDRLIL